MRRVAAALLISLSVAACVGGKGAPGGITTPPPALNTATITVDSGPAAASGAVNRAYVTVRVCAPGSSTQCANIDHVLLDTGSWGLRLVRSTLTGAGVALAAEKDAQGNAVQECATFGAGQTWGPVATADVSIAGETAAAVPVQVLDDTGSGPAPPAGCGALGIVNHVTDWSANGILGIGVFAQDCGAGCAGAATPLPVYFGCTAAGACSAENVGLEAQVANPVARFAADNNGVIVHMAALVNANGDATAQGELVFGLGTQADNALPAGGLTLLGTDATGYFQTAYNGATTTQPATIDSGTDSYSFNDPAITVCSSGAWTGYYCPATDPQPLTAVNSSATVTSAIVAGGTGPVDFAISNPTNFVTGAAAFTGLASGAGAASFHWGMPFFWGRAVYVAIEGHAAGSYAGPFFGY